MPIKLKFHSQICKFPTISTTSMIFMNEISFHKNKLTFFQNQLPLPTTNTHKHYGEIHKPGDSIHQHITHIKKNLNYFIFNEIEIIKTKNNNKRKRNFRIHAKYKIKVFKANYADTWVFCCLFYYMAPLEPLKQTNKKPLLGLRHGPGMNERNNKQQKKSVYLFKR